MDNKNSEALVGKSANDYWQNVDLYIGGTEHATGHLIYSRFWNKFLFDLGIICKDEPFQKLINQGMIQGRSNFVYRIVGTNKFVSYNLKNEYETQQIHVDVNIVSNDVLDIERFRNWMPEYKDAEFVSGAIKDVVIRYFHLEKINVKSGTYVNKDKIIAIYGNTGSSTAAHLHVEVDLDAREKYANYTPQTSKSNNYLKAGVDSTINPRAVLWCKKSAPDNQYVIDSGYNTVDLNEINYQITE
jgi:hypothetical protein